MKYSQRKRPTAIFVHGIGGARFEHLPLRNLATQYGYTIVEYTYAKNFGQVPIRVLVEELTALVKQVNPVFLCGFSLGGLLCAITSANVRSLPVFTVCAPLKGSYSSIFMAWTHFSEVFPTSKLITSLQPKLKKLTLWSVYSPFDLMVFPGTSGCVGVSKNCSSPSHTFSAFTPATKRHFGRFLEHVQSLRTPDRRLISKA